MYVESSLLWCEMWRFGIANFLLLSSSPIFSLDSYLDLPSECNFFSNGTQPLWGWFIVFVFLVMCLFLQKKIQSLAPIPTFWFPHSLASTPMPRALLGVLLTIRGSHYLLEGLVNHWEMCSSAWVGWSNRWGKGWSSCWDKGLSTY